MTSPSVEKEITTMMKLIEAMENKTIKKYGFEAKRTIITFKITELLRKLFH